MNSITAGRELHPAPKMNQYFIVVTLQSYIKKRTCKLNCLQVLVLILLERA